MEAERNHLLYSLFLLLQTQLYNRHRNPLLFLMHPIHHARNQMATHLKRQRLSVQRVFISNEATLNVATCSTTTTRQGNSNRRRRLEKLKHGYH